MQASTSNHWATTAAAPTHILDIDGFGGTGGFQTKELACVEVESGVLYSESFRLAVPFAALSPKDRKTANYVTRFVHGMRYANRNECYGQGDVDDVVAWMLTRAGGPIVVGYKSGTLERDLANRLGVESVDLRYLGCPRFERLLDAADTRLAMYSIYGSSLYCDMHSCAAPGVRAHCPRMEVVLFREWYVNEMRK